MSNARTFVIWDHRRKRTRVNSQEWLKKEKEEDHLGIKEHENSGGAEVGKHNSETQSKAAQNPGSTAVSSPAEETQSRRMGEGNTLIRGDESWGRLCLVLILPQKHKSLKVWAMVSFLMYFSTKTSVFLAYGLPNEWYLRKCSIDVGPKRVKDYYKHDLCCAGLGIWRLWCRIVCLLRLACLLRPQPPTCPQGLP